MTERWKGSLANAAERLRRSLGWTSAGGIDVQFPGPPVPLQPVVITDDATRPGAHAGGQSGRRWMSPHESIAPIAEDEYSGSFLQADGGASRGVIIDSLDVCRHASANLPSDVRFRLIIFPPGTTPNDGAADLVPIRQPIFVEGMTSSFDYAPLGLAYFLSDALPVGGGVEVGRWITEAPSGADNQLVNRFLIPTQIYLLPLSWIGMVFDPSENADPEAMHWTITWQGRSF